MSLAEAVPSTRRAVSLPLDQRGKAIQTAWEPRHRCGVHLGTMAAAARRAAGGAAACSTADDSHYVHVADKYEEAFFYSSIEYREWAMQHVIRHFGLPAQVVVG